MPELPEVETMRRGILPLIGRRILNVRFPRSDLKTISIHPSSRQFRSRVLNQTILDVIRTGKRVVLRLTGQYFVVAEPRMTGLLLVSDPPDRQHLRVGFQLDHPKIPWLWYWDRRGLGSVLLVDRRQLEERLERLGPDALTIDVRQLQARLGHSRRAVKVALLDQTALAGIGNLYASEILFVAKVHPARPCNQLTPRQWHRIHQAIQWVLREAIDYEGSTLDDGTYRNALNQFGRYQNHHRVYARAGQPCPQCRTRIARCVLAGRSTFFCPRCQRCPRRAGA